MLSGITWYALRERDFAQAKVTAPRRVKQQPRRTPGIANERRRIAQKEQGSLPRVNSPARSETERNKHFNLSLLLAVESLQIEPTREAARLCSKA